MAVLRRQNHSEHQGDVIIDAARNVGIQKYKNQSSWEFAFIHFSILNHFNQERHLYNRQTFNLNRAAALAEWSELAI